MEIYSQIFNVPALIQASGLGASSAQPDHRTYVPLNIAEQT
jgi:hypothetical protein